MRRIFCIAYDGGQVFLNSMTSDSCFGLFLSWVALGSALCAFVASYVFVDIIERSCFENMCVSFYVVVIIFRLKVLSELKYSYNHNAN